MKKVILTICLLISAATVTFAQGGAAKKQAQIKLGLKEEVKLTDAQIESVMSIENEIKPKVKALKADQTLTEADKKAKMSQIRKEKSQKIEAALGKDLAKKVDEYYSRLKKSDDGDGKKKKEDSKG